jgi:hypothetical protein
LPTKLNVPDTDPLDVVTKVKFPPKPAPNPASRPTRISNVPTALAGNALTTSVITRFSTTLPTNTSTFTKNVPDWVGRPLTWPVNRSNSIPLGSPVTFCTVPTPSPTLSANVSPTRLTAPAA